MCTRAEGEKGRGFLVQKHPRGYKTLRDSLLEDLRRREIDQNVYQDKVQEYMDLWERRQALVADIRERGITVKDEKRGMMVENRSVSLEVQVSRQMLAIFAAMGFKDQACDAVAPKGEDDEL